MTKIDFIGQFKGGKLHIINKKRVMEDFRCMPDCDVEIEIKKRGRRSTQQNRYYFGCVLKEIQARLRELGTDTDVETIHEWCKLKFNPTKIVTSQAEVIEMGKTTTEMNKDQFSEYVEKIRAWAADILEIWIPDPNTQAQMFQ